MKFAAWFEPNLSWIAVCAGFSAILGHCFPFYLHFRGGRGTAAFGGLVLAYRPLLFLFLLLSGVIVIIIVNHAVALPFYAAIFFIVFVLIAERNPVFVILAALSVIVVIERNLGGLKKAIKKEDTPVREFIKGRMFHKSNVG